MKVGIIISLTLAFYGLVMVKSNESGQLLCHDNSPEDGHERNALGDVVICAGMMEDQVYKCKWQSKSMYIVFL